MSNLSLFDLKILILDIMSTLTKSYLMLMLYFKSLKIYDSKQFFKICVNNLFY